MQVTKLFWTEAAGWAGPDKPFSAADLVLYFGSRPILASEACYRDLKRISRLGFYSYGEISPHAMSGYCELHNQTMTVTIIREAA